MSVACGSIIGIKPKLEEDGSIMMQVADFGGEPFDVWVTPYQIETLLGLLQQSVLRKIEGTGEAGRYPQATIEKVQVAYQGDKAALLVSTDQIGAVALMADDQMLQTLIGEIEKARQFLSQLRH